jgi:hypothetical protein
MELIEAIIDKSRDRDRDRDRDKDREAVIIEEDIREDIEYERGDDTDADGPHYEK